VEREESQDILVRLKLIGSMEAADPSGNNVLPPSRKARALLSYLALNAGQWVPRSRITRLLWDRVPEEQGRASLRQALHELSRAMGPAFHKAMETERERLRLLSEVVWVDALVVGTPAAGEGADSLPDLNVFSGSLLLDGLDNLSDEFDHWLVAERQKLEERIRRWNEARIQTGLQEPGAHQQRVEMARRAVATDPTNEEAVRELMRVLAGSGQRAQAVLEYERCRKILRSHLDLEPAPETQRLYRELRRGPAWEQSPAAPTAGSDLTQRIQQLRKGARAVLHTDAIRAAPIAKDETGPIVRWSDFVAAVAADVLPQVGGRMVKSLGEGMLLEFADARSAAAAAFAIQARSRRLNEGAEPAKHLHLRMGIEVGDVVADQVGDSVSAARIATTLAGPGETVITAEARDQLTPVLDADVEDLGDCHAKGIRGPIRAYRIGPPSPHPVVASVTSQDRLMPTIAVIPFASRMSSPEHDVVGEVLADDLIRLLSRSQSLDVISRLSTTVFRGRATSIASIGGHLNADYVLSGVYRTDGRTITLDLELSEVRSERIVWSERLKDKLAGILDSEQELVNLAAPKIYQAILAQELKRARSHPLPTLESYTMLMSAITLMHRRSPRDFQSARKMLLALIERDPRRSLPQAWLALWYVLRIQQGTTDNIQRDTADAIRCTNQALETDPDSSLALAIDGLVHTHMTKRHDLAEERYSLAIQNNPNDALAWLWKGTHHAFEGDGPQAVKDTQRALRLSPLDPHSYYFHSLSATAYITAGDNERALEHAELSLRANRLHTSTLRVKAVAQWRSGLRKEARTTASELLRLEPNLTVSEWLSRSPSAQYDNGKAFARTLAEIGVRR
jgi:DNA-binding SARP family transcriptional activator/TolB-like protein